ARFSRTWPSSGRWTASCARRRSRPPREPPTLRNGTCATCSTGRELRLRDRPIPASGLLARAGPDDEGEPEADRAFLPRGEQPGSPAVLAGLPNLDARDARHATTSSATTSTGAPDSSATPARVFNTNVVRSSTGTLRPRPTGSTWQR